MLQKVWIIIIVLILAIGIVLAVRLQKKQTAKSTYYALEHRQENEAYLRAAKGVIYEVNIRQYTPEGTFKAFMKHLPRLKELGVDILWIMPIHPIGEKNRKGSLGSYYAVKDYYEINPEFGTKEDFKQLVDEAHKLGMLVIMDWVANHTAWDNPWIEQHPDWYNRDEQGNIKSPVADWTDVADLNYDNPQLRKEMINAMKYWVKEFDIDGFRCDVAGMVPVTFWDSARAELEKIKPVFMLAEAEEPVLNVFAFDAYYGWYVYHAMNEIAAGRKTVRYLKQALENNKDRFPERAMRMMFTSNHDENSWHGSVFERMPNSYKTFAALTFILPDLPLIYSGQEACLDKRLKFFDKDTIEWKDCEMFEFYKKLIDLRHNHPALWGGILRGNVKLLRTSKPKKVLAVLRHKPEDIVIGLFNLSNDTVKFKVGFTGKFIDYFANSEIQVDTATRFTFMPFEFKILLRQ